jgi:hypothetical protein
VASDELRRVLGNDPRDVRHERDDGQPRARVTGIRFLLEGSAARIGVKGATRAQEPQQTPRILGVQVCS